MKHTQKGFSAVEVLVVLVIVGLLGAVGWLVYDKQNASNTTKSTNQKTTASTPASETKKTTAYEPTISKGWVVMTEPVSAISYAVNPDWPNETKVDTYAVDTDIPVGYGAPVALRYNSATKAWEEYESGTKRTNMTVKSSDVKVLGTLPTATYVTGDGPGGQQRILFVRGSEVVQLSLPSFEGDNIYSSSVNDVIRSIESFQ